MSYQKLGVATCFLLILLLSTLPTALARRAAPATNLTLYADTLSAGWQNWSWDTTADAAATTTVHSGSKANDPKWSFVHRPNNKTSSTSFHPTWGTTLCGDEIIGLGSTIYC